jgi:hypothetical protein
MLGSGAWGVPSESLVGVLGPAMGRHWQRFAEECGLGARQVLARVRALAQLALAETEAAVAEVIAMPAGGHVILDQTRRSIEDRAHAPRGDTSRETLSKTGPRLQ